MADAWESHVTLTVNGQPRAVSVDNRTSLLDPAARTARAHRHEEGLRPRSVRRLPGGGKGIGEIGIVGTAAAIGNAVYHATGWRFRDLPITPARVLSPASVP